MMHHPNMHHQAMSGHPAQHLPAHQGMPGHHQMPPHQLHRENRHVTLTRVPLGPSGGVGVGVGVGSGGGHQLGVGAHGGHQHQHQLGALGALGPHAHGHGHAQRPPHAIRAMHHPQPQPPQHHTHPPRGVGSAMKPMRRGYMGGYGPAPGALAYPDPRSEPPHPPHSAPAPNPVNAPIVTQPQHQVGLCRPSSPKMSTVTPQPKLTADFGVQSTTPPTNGAGAGAGGGEPAEGAEGAAGDAGGAAAGDSEATRPPPPANSKEKTPMCLVNELARYNKIKHQYRLTSETGPAHKKVFTVTLRLGDTEEYTAEGSSIKRAQHAAASAALAGTSYAPPSPRVPPAHAHTHPAHRHNVMPTVELNALAMKLCQPAVYTSIPPVPAPPRMARARPQAPYRMPPFVPNAFHQRMLSPGLLYRVRVCVGGRAWLGEGPTPQAARHDAAARALHDLRPPADAHASAKPAQAQPDNDQDNGDAGADLLNSEVKSPVSLVHELALKRNLSVLFTVKSERGPPHMRVFVTACTVGDMETEGEGNGKKVSKRRAAEKMLEEMRRRWPPALLRARPPHDRRKPPPAKKKPRNLIKEGVSGGGGSGGGGGADNPISVLAVARHAVRARSPQYRVLEERGAARRREFLVQCDAPPHSAVGQGPNKKTAKRRAATNVLLAMEMANSEKAASGAASPDKPGDGAATNGNGAGDAKRKEGDGGGGGDARQPVPGVLLMDYHSRSPQPSAGGSAAGSSTNGVSESNTSGGAGGNTPGAKDQLMYLSQLLGFTVQFSDFPKRNHGEYLSLVSLSTEPPVMCHGGGPSTQHSHEQCSRAALRALKLMGLDAPTTGMPIAAGVAPSANVISNGISE